MTSRRTRALMWLSVLAPLAVISPIAFSGFLYYRRIVSAQTTGFVIFHFHRSSFAILVGSWLVALAAALISLLHDKKKSKQQTNE